MLDVTTTDYHTAGEPFRIVTGGAPEVPGETVGARRVHALTDPDAEAVRTLVVHEPRGHADMYGCLVVEPDDEGAHLGALFFHKDGWSTACGHGTIALGAWAVDTGRVAAPDDGEVDVVVDVPSGRVTARVTRVGGRTTSIAFVNVPARVTARGVPAAGVTADVAFGGATYASVRAADLGLRVDAAQLGDLIAAGRAVKADLDGTPATVHPTDPRLSGLYGTTLWEEVAPGHHRSVTVFADGEVDRSPCGSGTSARCALLHDAGELPTGAVLRHDSIIGTTFHARVLSEEPTGVVTAVEGLAHRTGEHRFVLDPADALGTGFVLR